MPSPSGLPEWVCQPPVNLYAAAIYYATATLTSIGYGDISATHGNAFEQLFSTVIMFANSVTWGAVIATFCEVSSRLLPIAPRCSRLLLIAPDCHNACHNNCHNNCHPLRKARATTTPVAFHSPLAERRLERMCVAGDGDDEPGGHRLSHHDGQLEPFHE